MRPVMSVRWLVPVLLAGAVSCSDSTTPESSQIVGGWISPRETLQPSGSMMKFLSFSESGTFNFTVNTYGIYGGNGSSVAAYTHISGTYQQDGDRLVLTANRVATWDSFYGAGSTETVEQVNMTIFDQARFRILGFHLVLDYITYPADGPVPTTASFTRLGLD